MSALTLLTVMLPRQVPVRLVAGSVGSVGISSPHAAEMSAATISTHFSSRIQLPDTLYAVSGAAASAGGAHHELAG